MSRYGLTAILAAIVFAAGCSSGGSSGGSSTPAACSNVGQKQFVLDIMEDIYFWVDQLPNVNPNSFATAEDLLEALKFQPLDRFSSIDSEAADTALFSFGQFIGLGFGTQLLGSDDLRLTQVFTDSPAGVAGLQRGYRILEIDGRTIAEITAAEGVSAAFGPADVGFAVTLRYRDLGGAEAEVTLLKAVVTIDPVPTLRVFDVGGTPTGYLHFRIFVDTSVAELQNAFAMFTSMGVQDLIVDLRYNGGGLVTVAELLGNLLGRGQDGNVFSSTLFNANNTFRNNTTLFAAEVNALNLSRVVIIATGATASASELVINSLFPYMDVVIVGEDTFGKPVGSLGFLFCSKVLRPISFETVNANGDGDYFTGLPVDCAATDDLDVPLGEATEASLAEALFYLQNGTCSPAVPIAEQGLSQSRTARMKSIADRDPVWRMINAY